MAVETKICQNCKQQFTIEPEDFQFYEKIKVPAPTWCSRCRQERRLTFFNLINLYKRKCDLCKKDSISMYPPEAPYTIYCPKCWWGDGWDPFSYGRDYDFSRPFFDQLNELWHQTPLLGLSIGQYALVTSPYTNHSDHLKNCYLIFWADFSEDCAYGFFVFKNKMLFDCSCLLSCELSYDLFHAHKVARSIGSYDLLESLNCAFLRDSENCQDCFASANLRGKKYHFFNKPLSKEHYFEELKKYNLGSYRNYEEAKRQADEHWKKFPPRPVYEKFAVNSTGNRIYESKNCKECFEVAGVENGKYLSLLYQKPVSDCYDLSGWGNNMSLCYECGVVGENVSNIKFSQESGITLHDVEDGKLSIGGGHHFGCVSVKKGEYCILNKRYEKAEYEKLRAKIIDHMNSMPYTDKQGRVYKYGEFFPPEFSPLAYNETIANKFFSLSKNEILARGYRYREPDTREYAITMPAKELPDHIKDAPDSILNEVVGCGACPRGFKIIKAELDFLRQMNLPLPRRCPFCRIEEKLDKWVKESRLVKRSCDKCGVEFETPHTKEEVAYILCKKCWRVEFS